MKIEFSLDNRQLVTFIVFFICISTVGIVLAQTGTQSHPWSQITSVSVTSSNIADGTIRNVDIASDADIHGSKIYPLFTRNVFVGTDGFLITMNGAIQRRDPGGQFLFSGTDSGGSSGSNFEWDNNGDGFREMILDTSGNLMVSNLAGCEVVKTDGSGVMSCGTGGGGSVAWSDVTCNGCIDNADISSSAAIAGSKINPTFYQDVYAGSSGGMRIANNGIEKVGGSNLIIASNGGNFEWESDGIGSAGLREMYLSFTGHLRVPYYSNCNLETDGSGNVQCGVDDTGGDDDWTIDGSDIYKSLGDVGIGTTSPSARLHVAGNFRLGSSGSTMQSITTGSYGNYDPPSISPGGITTRSVSLGNSVPVGSPCIAGHSAQLTAIYLSCRVTGATTATVTLTNLGSNTLNMGTGTLKVVVFNF